MNRFVFCKIELSLTYNFVLKYTVEEIFHKKGKVFSVKTNRRQLLRKTLGEMVATNEHKSRKVKNKNK